jgi:sugar O-acyltransferase (sialic acid O-acetyltransferase NeuD family)
MNEIFGVFGVGGCGRSLMPVVADTVYKAGFSKNCVFFVDDFVDKIQCNGHRVFKFSEFLEIKCEKKSIIVAIADPQLRRQIVNRIEVERISFFGTEHTNVLQMHDVLLGEGAAISPFVTFTCNIRIGRHFHANLYSYIEHDCVIGDFVTFAPGVKCNGGVHIGDGAYIGSGAIIKQGIEIGKNATIGMGAVVVKDVLPNTTVVGNPAKALTI